MLNEKRLKEIVNNILAEIVNTTEMDTATYLSWLKSEVGITNDELVELQGDGLLPMPVELQAER